MLEEGSWHLHDDVGGLASYSLFDYKLSNDRPVRGKF